MEQSPETSPKQTSGERALSEAKIAPVSLPMGGGAVRGMGEKFSVNPATGTGRLEIPLPLSPCRGGSGPRHSLSYDSGTGNGIFGAGWSIPVTAITRRTDKGLPRYRDREFDDRADTFVWSGSEDLVPATRAAAGGGREPDIRTLVESGVSYVLRRYLPRTEGSFARIERWDAPDGSIHWRVTSRENVTEILGRDPSCRIADPTDPTRVFSWLLEEVRDDRGNVAQYRHVAEDLAGRDASSPHEANRTDGSGQRHLKRILYGNRTPFQASDFAFEAVLDYGDHPASSPAPSPDRPWIHRRDAFSTHRPGFEVRTRRLCRRVLMFHRFPELGADPVLVRSCVFGYDERDDLSRLVRVVSRGHGTGIPDQELPPVEFGYSDPEPAVAASVAEAPDLPEGIDGSRFQWVDLDGDGIPGVLAPQGDAWWYVPNLGEGRFGRRRLLPGRPSLARSSSARLVDIAGEGRLALAEFGGDQAGFVERREGPFEGGVEPGWEPFRPFAGRPGVDWSSPHLHQIDLDGDGLPDLLVTDSDIFRWHPSLGREGYGPALPLPNPGVADEEKGPRFLTGSGTESIHLADLSGDGLADIVRVRNGEVCYWPNLGHGRFGAKVTMDRSPVFGPPDSFSPSRLRLADLDGNGLADLLLLEGSRVRIWRNLSGNAWSDAEVVEGMPDTGEGTSVQVADFLGRGTACLVWSSPLPSSLAAPLRYLDLMGRKPHLLVAVRNNLGARTELEYASSTRFFLADREAGRPWATRLPFPVQVVAKSTTVEESTGTALVARYAYHHGHWDGLEREFRGFARVQRWDAETWSGTAGDPGRNLTRPPVRTETWFHTGAWFGMESLQERLASEWFRGDGRAWDPPRSDLPLGLAPRETREAHRALRGRLLREEVYSEDGSDLAAFPHSVVEQSHRVATVQGKDGVPGLAHAVFLVTDLEKRTAHYERNPSDPRLQQELTLEVDDFGTPVRAAAVGYPRRAPEGPAQAEQSTHHITLHTMTVAHQTAPSGPHRIAVPVETRSWELSGLTLPAGRPFTAAELDAACGSALEIPFERDPSAGAVQKRCLETRRILYCDSNLSIAPLALGDPGAWALPHTTWVAAYTSAFVAGTYGSRLTDADLTAAGYSHFPGDSDGIWWARSSRLLHDPDRFLLPTGAVDPWGNTSHQTWDVHSLLVESSVDPLQNRVSARNHYRVLAPWTITDPNGNLSAARFDALGRVVATFQLGKWDGTEFEGDFLDVASAEPSSLDEPTSTIQYDLSVLPVRVRTRSREWHLSSPNGSTTRWQETWLYTDGLGREILTKVQAEPGSAFVHDAAGVLVRDAAGKPSVATTRTRWVGTGRKVHDSKGQVVKRYEPYFTDTPGFDSEPELVQTGVSAVLGYDPVGRLIRTDLPDGTFTKMEFGPWIQATWDASDTVLQSAWYTAATAASDPAVRRAAQLAAAHANTPAVVHLDSLGRPVVGIAQIDATSFQTTRSTLDLEGNLLRQVVSRDATTTLAVLTQTFDSLGRVCMARNPDSGAKLIWRDVASQTLRSWDHPSTPDERSISFTYDPLRRPLTRSVTAGGRNYLAESTTYGESLGDPVAKDRNARGQAYSHKDGAGIATDEQRDFHGKVTRSVRQLARFAKTVPDWSRQVDLESETFTTLTAFDALGRVVRIATPHNATVAASQILPVYNEANLLDKVQLKLRGATTATDIVTSIDYDAKGQRQRIQYGNGASTRYQYDPKTWRLTDLLTTRNGGTEKLQDLSYTYDPSGNVVQITDAAQQTVFFDNQVVSPTALYEYDALYRLTQATGREHTGNGASTEPEREGFNAPQNLPSDGQSLRNYTRSWTYDAIGNILSLVHQATGGNWSRSYAYEAASNRLASTTTGTSTESFAHDAAGCMVKMPHLDVLDWTPDNRLLHIQRGGTDTWYSYDSAGQRVRKHTEKAGFTEERLYLGGFEIYRKLQGTTVILERETLHILDGNRRVALIETKTADSLNSSFAPTTVTRYQLDNHLQSATLELDETASVISYEEYYPYGDTSYRSAKSGVEVSEKRYRYTGKEKDEESGLYYHGARYYAAWLGRWTAADPAGMVDGACLYAYVRNHPTGLVDPDGRAADTLSIQPHHKDSRGEEIFNKVASLTEEDKTAASKSVKEKWGVTPRDWLITSPDDDITKSYSELYELIDSAAEQNGLSPEFLHSVFMGEGMNIRVAELIQSGTKATDREEIWTESYAYTGLDNIGKNAQHLVDKGYLDRKYLVDIIPTAPRLNEKREIVYPADIKGLDTIVFALAATLHDAKDRTMSELTAGKKLDTVNDPEKVNLLTYARFNNEDVGKDAAKRPDVYTRKNVRPERKDQKNVRYNSLVRVATEERLKILGIYAR